MQLSTESIKFALAHLKKHRDTDILPHQFEFGLITKDVISWISEQNICDWEIGEITRCLVTKQSKGFRNITLLDPLDTLIYTALVVQEGKKLEKERISLTRKIVFSNRFHISKKHVYFLRRNAWSDFIDESIKLSKKYKCILKTDIADFFPRLYLHDVERGISKSTLKEVQKAFYSLLSQVNSSQTIGIPIGTKASFFVAEIALNDLDKELCAHKIPYCRYVDDFRIFANSFRELRYYHFLLGQLLIERYSLTIQGAKTKFLSSEEYIRECKENSPENIKWLFSKSKEKAFDEFKELKSFLENPYETDEDIKFSEEELDKIESLHLNLILSEELNKTELDYGRIGHLIALFKKTSAEKIINVIINHIERLIPILPRVMRFFIDSANELKTDNKRTIKNLLLKMLFERKDLAHIPYYKVWIVHTLSCYGNVIDEEDISKFISNFNLQDEYTKRHIMILLGKTNQGYWFRSKKGEFSRFSNGEKRAFIKGFALCIEDARERQAFRKAIKGVIREKDEYMLVLL